MNTKDLPGPDLRGRAVVDRVVSGSLVYATLADTRATFAFTPGCLRFRRKDGSIQRYRGEPLASVGLQPGASVSVEEQGGAPVVTLDYNPPTARGWFR